MATDKKCCSAKCFFNKEESAEFLKFPTMTELQMKRFYSEQIQSNYELSDE